MLTRLLKYELKATARVFLPIYIVLIVFAAISKLIFNFSGSGFNVPAMISILVYITILVGMFVMTFVVMIQRFYKNLLSDEGYLMFTLPTRTWKHITCKLLVSMLWTMASSVVAFLSIIVVAYDEVFITKFLGDISKLFSEFFRFFGISSSLIILEFLLMTIISMASGILIIYASIAIGHLFNRHKILAALGAFLALSTLSQILFFAVTSIPSLNHLVTYIESLDGIQLINTVLHSFMLFMIIFFGLISTGYFFVANHILSRRLNLE